MAFFSHRVAPRGVSIRIAARPRRPKQQRRHRHCT
jgi:hypothetical protein